MKRGLLLIMLAVGVCGIAKAQTETTVIDVRESLPGYRTTFEANKFWHNWFVSANFGGSSLVAENFEDADFKNTITFFPNISVGKWFNPWWGIRLQGGGGSLHGFPGDGSMLHMHYIQAHADFMLGLINFFGKYKENRKFDIVPFAGIGGFSRKKDQSFTINGGIQFRYAICDKFDVNIEAQGIILDDDMVARGGFPNDGIAGITAGVTYRFKNRGFRVAPNSSEVDQLAAANAMLKNKVSQLENRPPEVKEVIKEVVKEVPAGTGAGSASNLALSELPITIMFKFNSAEIQPINEPSIFNIAKVLKDNPNMKARIVGYADKFGPINVNMRISQARAEAVAKLLEKDYKISRDRMIIEFVGKEKPYYQNENSWNRAAMVEFID